MGIEKISSMVYQTGRNHFLAQKAMNSTMGKEFPKHTQMLKTVSKYQGEVFNILVNAVGTALVAPIFIAYNPLSKTDENTKKYSALRQPVSAVLAIATQVGLVIPWNRFVDYMTNNGKLGQYYSQEAFKDAKYLMRQAKKANPKATKKELEEIVKNQQADQYAKLFEEFSQTGKMTVGGKQLPESQIRELIGATASEYIKSADTESLRYYGEQYKNKINRAQFLRDNPDVVAKKLSAIKNEVNAKGTKEEITKFIKEQIATAKKQGAVDEWLKILEDDILPRCCQDKESVVKKISDIETQTKFYQTKFSNFGEIREYINKSLGRKDDAIKIKKNLWEKVKKGADSNMSIDELLNLIKSEIVAEDKPIAKIVDNYTSTIGKRIKGFKAVSGLLVSLAIMPITCCALNYLYPRFMDMFFPHLAKAKKGGK